MRRPDPGQGGHPERKPTEGSRIVGSRQAGSEPEEDTRMTPDSSSDDSTAPAKER